MDKPWLILGDFNSILPVDEKKGGRNPLSSSIRDFQDCIDLCGLLQAPKSGLEFSWCNGRVGNKRILCNLDRALFNLKWLKTFNGWHYHVGTRGISDHGPLIRSNTIIPRASNIPFRFQKMCLNHPYFLQIMCESWNEDIDGNPIFVFMNKLKRLKKILKIWNWEVFGDVNVKLKNVEDKVMETTLNYDKDPYDIYLLHSLVVARGEYEIAANNYNTFLRDRARINWIKDGDINSKFFHTNIKLRQAQNSIAEIEDPSGNIITNQKGITDVLIDHFSKKFEHHHVQISDSIFDDVPQVISDDDNSILEAVPDFSEIKNVVFEINQDGAPGPDGFNGAFYRNAWDIISKDLVEAITFCWSTKLIPSGMNSNFLVVIPKIKGAKHAKKFRPIGLSNFFFKIITKIITIRLSRVIHKVVSQQQCAFIKNKNIHEQVLLASEMINEMSITIRGGNLGLKLDISQAYDTLS
ncbi:uncharacterized protein LOC113273281 [Papaver somniferum]|uniref:uncharacterized protein LOC113273281 n=1 Tax=Papaver somniferum TaxID=3469 RepID=UPI000E6FB765|nr:uncharacterized protein LOC113273281 [Papaver somniferum]